MAISPIKSIGELPYLSFKQVFKSFREIGKNQNFINIFITCLEHLIIYTRGAGLKEFIETVFSMISSEQLESIKELFSDVFEDLEDLMNKKQMKILTSMIYDCNFINFLVNFSEMIEVPVVKSSSDESFNEFFYFSEKMRINFVILTIKWKETKLLHQNSLVSLYLLAEKSGFIVLFPVKYQNLYLKSNEEQEEKIVKDEDMRKINNISNNVKQNTRSLSEASHKLRNFSSDNKDDVENRMRLRAKALKQKREQKRQDEIIKKQEQEKIAELEKAENLEKLQQFEMRESEKIREKARLEEENKMLREWKKSEDEKNLKKQEKIWNDLENNQFSEDENLIQAIENIHKSEEEKILEEKKNLELQKQELENLMNEKNKISEDLKIAEAKMIEEEQKLLQEKNFHEKRKIEVEKNIANERLQLMVKKQEEEKWISDERHKLEVFKIHEERKLQDELRKIESRRLAEDRKIAEEKRFVAESRLKEMKIMMKEFKRGSKTPQLVMSSETESNSFKIDSNKSKKPEDSSETQKKIQEIIDSLGNSEKNKRNFTFTELSTLKSDEILINTLRKEKIPKISSKEEKIPKISSKEEKIPKDEKISKFRPRNERIFKIPLKEEKISEIPSKDEKISKSFSKEEEKKEITDTKQEIFMKNYLKFKQKSKLGQQTPTEEKKESWLDEQKRLIEVKKIEVEKLLESTKKIEFRRNSDRRKTEEKSILEESRKILENKKNQRAGRFTSFDNSIQDLSPIDKKCKGPQSVLGGGIFDEIFSKSMSHSSDKFEDDLEEIRELSSNLKDLNLTNSNFSSPSSIIKLEPVQMSESNPTPKDPPEAPTLPKSIHSDLKSEGTCDKKSICGGLFCLQCSKDLKKSSLFLKCQNCCPSFFKALPHQSSKVIYPSKKQTCLKCSQNFSKGEEIWCFCCFLQLKIFNKPFTTCESCQKPGSLQWVDANFGENLEVCNFCGEKRIQSALLEICGKCEEIICFICLRKNPFVASGICSSCHNGRMVKAHDFHNNSK